MFQASALTIGYSLVRDRNRSPQDPNRPAMTAANSPKKRKRPLSPLPISKIPLHSTQDTAINMASENKSNVHLIFEASLEDDKSITNYAEERERLVESERQNAWDREARYNPSSQEERAANIIFAIREWERNVIFGNLPSETLPKKDDRDMGGQYLTNKEYIDTRSKLFEISKMVPKGALLHLHFNAELHPELLLVQARNTENMYIRSIRRIENEEDLKETEMVFCVLDRKTVDPSINIFSDTYPTCTNFKDEAVKDKIWMLWSKFQDEFERKFPGKYKQQEPETFREGNLPSHCGQPTVISLRPAENWLRSKMVLSETEAYRPTQTVNGYVLPDLISIFVNVITAFGRVSTKRLEPLKAC